MLQLIKNLFNWLTLNHMEKSRHLIDDSDIKFNSTWLAVTAQIIILWNKVLWEYKSGKTEKNYSWSFMKANYLPAFRQKTI